MPEIKESQKQTLLEYLNGLPSINFHSSFAKRFNTWVTSHNEGNDAEKKESFENLLNWNREKDSNCYIELYLTLNQHCRFDSTESDIYSKVYIECITDDDYDSDDDSKIDDDAYTASSSASSSNPSKRGRSRRELSPTTVLSISMFPNKKNQPKPYQGIEMMSMNTGTK